MISMGIALMGVDNIVGLTTPVLKILYPIIIVLVMLTLIGKFINHNRIYKITVYTTLIIAVVDVISETFKVTSIQTIMDYIPLSSQGFAWVIPALIAFVIAKLTTLNKSI
ncbi:MAG: branched-chain amino acid transport system II carrier protein [Cellulosilyticaceae bacterium]